MVTLISRIGSISKWPSQCTYNEIHMYIFHKLLHLAYIKTYQVVLNAPSTTVVVNTWSSNAKIQPLDIQNAKSLTFFPPFMKTGLFCNNAII